MEENIQIKLVNPLTIELKNLLYDNVKIEELTIEEVLTEYGDYLTNDQKEILRNYEKNRNSRNHRN